MEAGLQSLRRPVFLLPKRISFHGLLIYILARVAISVCPCLHRVEPATGCHADVEHNVKVWLWLRGVCFEIGIAGLLVKIIGVRLHCLWGLRKEQFGNEFADGFVGHYDRARMDVDLDREMTGNVLLGRKATGDQV